MNTFFAAPLSWHVQGIGLTSPNPCVGAVIVDSQGQVVGEGSHTFEGVKHAEVLALEQAGQAKLAAELFTSTSNLARIRAAPGLAPMPSSRPGFAGWWPACRTRIRWSRARVSSVCAMPESPSRQAFWKKKRKC